MGENQLAMWAAEAGITANRVGRDETGWDFFLEFHREYSLGSKHAPLDLQPKPLQALLQVKATDGRDGRVAVKLDHWLRLVKTSLPAFFLVLEFDKQPTCQRAFLIHVDEVRIRQVLQRVRELSTSGSAPLLHKHSIVLRYTSADALASQDGNSLAEALTRHVGLDPERYERRKREWVDRVGYEDGLGELRLKFVLPAEDPEGHLVDFALGRVPNLKLAGGEFRDVRFGIPQATPGLTFAKGSALSGGQFVQETILKFRWKPGRQARIRASVHSPRSVAGIVRPEALKFRISNDFMEIVAPIEVNPEVDLRLSLPDFDDEYSLTYLRDFAELLQLLDDASRVPEQSIALEFVVDSAPGQKNIFGLSGASIIPDMLTWASAVRHAWQAAEHFGIQEDTSLTRRATMRQAKALLDIDAALRGDPIESGFCFMTTTRFPDIEGEICLPFCHSAEIGAHRLVVPVAYFGVIGSSGTLGENEFWHDFSASRVEVIREQLISAHASFGKAEIELILEAIAEEFGVRANIIRWWHHTRN